MKPRVGSFLLGVALVACAALALLRFVPSPVPFGLVEKKGRKTLAASMADSPAPVSAMLTSIVLLPGAPAMVSAPPSGIASTAFVKMMLKA